MFVGQFATHLRFLYRNLYIFALNYYSLIVRSQKIVAKIFIIGFKKFFRLLNKMKKFTYTIK